MTWASALATPVRQRRAYASQKAMRLNPHYPEFYTMQIGQIYFDARLYELSVAALESLRGEDTVLACLYLAASHAALNHTDDAKRADKRALLVEPTAKLSKWASLELAPYKKARTGTSAGTLAQAGLPE